jgi:MFS family permease
MIQATTDHQPSCEKSCSSCRASPADGHGYGDPLKLACPASDPFERVFCQDYRSQFGFTGSTPEVIGLIAAAFMLMFMIIGSLLADMIDRRTILLVTAVVFLVFAIPYFYLVNTGSFVLATIGEVVGFGFVFGFGYGAIPAFYTENFPTRYRASGASAGYQISQVYGGGLIPIVAGLILSAYGIHRAYIFIGLLVMVYAVLAILAW